MQIFYPTYVLYNKRTTRMKLISFRISILYHDLRTFIQFSFLLYFPYELDVLLCDASYRKHPTKFFKS